MAVIIRNNKLFCDKCGGEFVLNFPIGIAEMTKKTELYTELHKDCKQTWKEPEPNLGNKTIQEKANWWFCNGEKGMSSETMYACFTGQKRFRVNFPYDPNDFMRCYKLLQAVPEWNTPQFMNKLKPLCPEWNNLVENWTKLTEMYEQNEKEKWKNHKKIGMYEFMQELIN